MSETVKEVENSREHFADITQNRELSKMETPDSSLARSRGAFRD